MFMCRSQGIWTSSDWCRISVTTCRCAMEKYFCLYYVFVVVCCHCCCMYLLYSL